MPCVRRIDLGAEVRAVARCHVVQHRARRQNQPPPGLVDSFPPGQPLEDCLHKTYGFAHRQQCTNVGFREIKHGAIVGQAFLPVHSAIHSTGLTPEAEADIEELYRWLIARSPLRGAEWFNGMMDAIEFLASHPQRCPLAPETPFFPEEIRQLLYGRA